MYYGHQRTFSDEDCRKDSGLKKGTALSAKVWEMKDKGIRPKMKWDIVDWAFPCKCWSKGSTSSSLLKSTAKVVKVLH